MLATAFLAASSKVVANIIGRPDSLRILLPSSTLVPEKIRTFWEWIISYTYSRVPLIWHQDTKKWYNLSNVCIVMGWFIILSIQILAKSITNYWSDCKALNVNKERFGWKIKNHFVHIFKEILGNTNLFHMVI